MIAKSRETIPLKIPRPAYLAKMTTDGKFWFHFQLVLFWGIVKRFLTAGFYIIQPFSESPDSRTESFSKMLPCKLFDCKVENMGFTAMGMRTFRNFVIGSEEIKFLIPISEKLPISSSCVPLEHFAPLFLPPRGVRSHIKCRLSI
jgi:hypothetical protein